MSQLRSSWLLAPVHALALATAAKSFRDNPILGSPSLNRIGLHVGRMRLADAAAQWRRHRLEPFVDRADAENFRSDGFVLKQDYLPKPLFDAVRCEALAVAAPAREMLQGDAVTRRIALDKPTLERLPAVRALVEDPKWLGLLRFVASSALTPLTYLQTIFSRVRPGEEDPQLRLHADTFHATVKAWFFLTDVSEDAGPFTYVPGSHRLTPMRLGWEKEVSLIARRSADNETQEGSFRIPPARLAELGLPPPRVLAVPANTLIVADTMGFHARGISRHPSMRVEIWAYGRRNPFLPWLGWDRVAMPVVKDHAVPLSWGMADLGERLKLKRNPWRRAGTLTPVAPPSLHLLS